MKILYISPQPIPSLSANSVHMMKMAQAMGGTHNVTLKCFTPITKDVPRTKEDICAYYHVQDNFHLSQFPLPQRHFLSKIAFAFQNGLKAKSYDLVFSRCLLSACCAVLFGGNVIFEIHDSPNTYSHALYRCFQGLKTHKNLRGIVVISDALKQHLIEKFQILPSKIVVAHDGADPISTTQALCPFDRKGFDFHAGYTGHLYEGRGIDIIAGAAQKLPDVAFHIVGGQPQDVAHWKSRFPTIENLKFYGHVQHGAVAGFLAHFDVLLAPYQRKVAVAGNKGDTASWMSPLKIFEYMSSGKPIISSDLPVLAEILQHKRNAYLCAPDSVDEWVSAIQTLKSTPHLSQSLAMTALKDFEDFYTWEKRAAHILERFAP